MNTTIPESHQKIYAYLQSIQADLAFILNLHSLKEEIADFPEEEVASRVKESWQSIRFHLIDALIVAHQEDKG